MGNSTLPQRVALLAFIVANVLDIVTTHLGLAAGIPEGNPLPAWVLSRWGELVMYALKVAVMATAVWIVFKLEGRRPRVWIAIYAVAAILTVVVAANSALIYY